MFNKNRKDYQDHFWGEKYSPTLQSVGEFILEVVKVVVISLAIIIPVRYFLIQPFYVKGASMEPNFYDHEYLIIDEISYRFKDPVRGDIVVFRYPKDQRQYFIKRIIGLPGEKIEIRDGRVYVYNQGYPHGQLVNETMYLGADITTSGDDIFSLGDNEYFVLGDNRSSSLDSRNFGPISRHLIIGRTWFRGWPLDKIDWFNAPGYNI